MSTDPINLDAARKQIERAHEEVAAICKDGRERWRMSIPAQSDRDSDLILSNGLNAGELALAEVERLRAENERLTKRVNGLILPMPAPRRRKGSR